MNNLILKLRMCIAAQLSTYRTMIANCSDSELKSELERIANNMDELLTETVDNPLDSVYDALLECETYLVERGIEHRGVTGRTVVLPKLRAAINKLNGE